MAYFSLHAYDADVFIPAFAGLYQTGDGTSGNVRFALEAENAETPGGVLQPMAAPDRLPEVFEKKIETLACLHRRWYEGGGSQDWLFAATDGKIYYKQVDSGDAWTLLDFPEGVTEYACSVWSYVGYEINPEGSAAPVDVLLLSNAEDGMIMISPPYTATESQEDWTVTAVDTQGKKFGVIERYAERIWGGAIPNDPDMLMYSAPYDPLNWAANPSIPEDGAGDVQQPSWDGDSFTALRTFGSQLVAFKKSRVWRILGTDPGEYTFKEQFGGGTPFANTICVDTERILMAEKDGLSVFDGMSVSPFRRQYIEKLWLRVNRNAMDQMCAAKFKNRYYLSIPVDGATANNALIIYNVEEDTMLFYPNMHVESFLSTEDKLYATSSVEPGRIFVINYDSWLTKHATKEPVKWVTPWMDFGYKRIQKGGFEVYFVPEVHGGPVTFRFGIETEKKIKYKTVTVQSTTFKLKQKRIRFGGTGRRFRLWIETESTAADTTWRFTGGIQMVVETDPD